MSAVAVAVAWGFAACGSSARPATNGTAGTLSIVAGENFWGSLAAQLAGKQGKVINVVTDPNADPHSYESSSDDARAFAGADYVVLNGAGYDAWAAKLLAGNPNPSRKVFSVADLLGKKEGDNPHFWYNPDYVAQVTNHIEADLKSLDPTASPYFDARRAVLDAASTPYRNRLAEIKSNFAGTPVASTESIFEYLAQYLGLELISPPEFMRAVSEGNDPPAPSVAVFEEQITKKRAKVLVYNLQASTAVTTNLRKLAARVGVPTAPVTETIQPPGDSFGHWFEAELLSLQNALIAGP